MTKTRREFLAAAAAAGGVLAAGGGGQAATKPHVSCNSYTWQTYYAREERDFNSSLDAGLGKVAQSGLNGYEPAILTPADIDRHAPLLKKHGLEMRSLYVNSTLHTPEGVDSSISNILAIAERARVAAGTRIIVTNPSPIRWGGPENKDDAQLRRQADAMDRLGAQLKAMGMTLAYHHHDIELRGAAREFHHMMVGTGPGNVHLCLDAHWVYRGAGNSSVALFDILRLYGPRIAELHLRQSVNHVWSETFGEGDLDYRALAAHLQSIRVQPHLVLEQAPEKGTPRTMTPVEAHRRSRECVDSVFSALMR